MVSLGTRALIPFPPLYDTQAYLTWRQCIALAGAVIGSFSWVNIPSPFWLSPALWYCSLFLTMLGILLSAQQITVLEIIGDPSAMPSKIQQQRCVAALMQLISKPSKGVSGKRESVRQARLPASQRGKLPKLNLEERDVSWKMVFMWQCPIMFMSYSVCLYLLGLTLYVCSPLIAGEWGPDSNVRPLTSSPIHQQWNIRPSLCIGLPLI